MGIEVQTLRQKIAAVPGAWKYQYRNSTDQSKHELGETPDYESQTVWVCLDCLEAAVSALKAAS